MTKRGASETWMGDRKHLIRTAQEIDRPSAPELHPHLDGSRIFSQSGVLESPCLSNLHCACIAPKRDFGLLADGPGVVYAFAHIRLWSRLEVVSGATSCICGIFSQLIRASDVHTSSTAFSAKTRSTARTALSPMSQLRTLEQLVHGVMEKLTAVVSCASRGRFGESDCHYPYSHRHLDVSVLSVWQERVQTESRYKLPQDECRQWCFQVLQRPSGYFQNYHCSDFDHPQAHEPLLK